MPAARLHQPITAEPLRTQLSTKWVGQRLHILDEVDSTNREALSLARQLAPAGTVVIADVQTAGRGRHGRQWFSPRGLHLYCSIIVHQPTSLSLASWLSFLPMVTGLACVRAVRDVSGLSAMLKWPNDVMVNERKAGGVLCETAKAEDSSTVAVVGVGINVNGGQDAFPQGIRATATTLEAESRHSVERLVLLAALLNALELQLDRLASNRVSSIRDEYSSLCSTLGRPVRIAFTDGTFVEGRAQAIGQDGRLHVQVAQGLGQPPTGQLIEVQAGDVIHLR
jgi:BirA family biotin operon repressor/biotin-[acetyl-CoA-carboxylase] ligase